MKLKKVLELTLLDLSEEILLNQLTDLRLIDFQTYQGIYLLRDPETKFKLIMLETENLNQQQLFLRKAQTNEN